MPYKDKAKEAEAKKRYEEKRKAKNGERHKVWTLIFYPSSAPKDWPELLSGIHLPIWVSPVHDKDVWTEADERKERDRINKEVAAGKPSRNPTHKAGTLKKPHYHLICQYETQVDRDTFLNDFKDLNGPESVKQVKSLISMVRYLVHADDPDKAQYDKADVKTFGGADLDLVEQVGTHERHEALKAMRKYIRTHNVVDFCDFVDYCDDCEITWSRLLDDNSSYIIEKYIKSLRYKRRDERERRIEGRSWVTTDMDTGEILDSSGMYDMEAERNEEKG